MIINSDTGSVSFVTDDNGLTLDSKSAAKMLLEVADSIDGLHPLAVTNWNSSAYQLREIAKMMPFFERALTPNGMWNAAIDAAAFEAWCACRNDLYVKSAGLEKVVPKRIRRLRKPTDRTLTESGDAN